MRREVHELPSYREVVRMTEVRLLPYARQMGAVWPDAGACDMRSSLTGVA